MKLCVLEYCSVICSVVSGAAHRKLRGVDVGHNRTEPLQAVIHCDHTFGYFFVLNVIKVCGGVIYPLAYY
jgi:hypothetical protein